MALTKLITDLIDGSLGTNWQTTPKTAAFTAVSGEGYFVNTTSAEITINLPAGVVGAEIVIQDYAGTFANNKVILVANGSDKIQGIESTSVTNYFKCAINNATVTLIYQDATKGWTSQDIARNLPNLAVEYLVIAGGGGAGLAHTGGGGGGAGGLLSGNMVDPQVSTNHTITVGAGGASQTGSTDTTGPNGSNSSIVSTYMDPISSIGGGGGGAWSAGGDGQDGGSGGGAEANGSPGVRTTGQGRDGGAGGGSPQYGAGGGGGAGSDGTSGTTQQGGNGGAGLSNNITGTATIYAGGGGGGAYNGGSPGSGGTGGGGSAGTFNNDGVSGTANTGGGGGGNGGAGTVAVTDSGAGGSGVVILRYQNVYTVTIGSGLTGSTATDGSYKVTTFTAGTGTISFS